MTFKTENTKQLIQALTLGIDNKIEICYWDYEIDDLNGSDKFYFDVEDFKDVFVGNKVFGIDIEDIVSVTIYSDLKIENMFMVNCID